MNRALFAWTLLLSCTVTVASSGCSTAKQFTQLLPNKGRTLATELDMARLHERQGQIGKAEEMYRKLAEKHPTNAEAFHRLGIVESRLGKHEASSKHLLKALDLAPNDGEILTDIGYAAYMQDDLEAAEIALEKALAISPQNKRAKNNLAMVLGKQGHMDESFALFRQVVGEAEANANLAYIHVQRGEGDEAIDRYSHSLTLDNKLTSSSHALLQLATLQQADNSNDELQYASHNAVEDDADAAGSGGQVVQTAAAEDDSTAGRAVAHISSVANAAPDAATAENAVADDEIRWRSASR